MGLLLGGVGVARTGWGYLKQRDAWAEAAEPNDVFLAKNARRLSTLRLGASYAPEQWTVNGPPPTSDIQPTCKPIA